MVDTTVLIDVLRGNAAVLAWLKAQQTRSLYVSAMTVGELYQGVHRQHAANPHQLAAALDDLRFDTLRPFSGRVLSFDRVAAEIWGRLMGEGMARGLVPPTDDAKIAATAIRHGMIVATSNTRHFSTLVTTVDPRAS